MLTTDKKDPWWANLATILVVLIVAVPVISVLAWVSVWLWVDLLHKLGR